MDDNETEPTPEEIARRTQQFVEYVVQVEHHSVHAPYQPGVVYACPCCRCKTLSERGYYDICPVCFWEDDGQDDPNADLVRGGPNGALSLTQARANFKEFGASRRDMLPHVRPPRPEEMPDPRAETVPPFACPCCGYFTLDTRGEDDLCPVCFWMDDGQGDADADEVQEGSNYGLSLTQARANFKAFGACEQAHLEDVRPPRPEEMPDSV